MNPLSFLAADDPVRVEYIDPDGLAFLAIGLTVILLLVLVLYLLLQGLLYVHRKRFNLTRVERARPDKDKKPAFLEVDHEARAEAIERGDEYVRPADREEAPAEAVQKEKKLSGWAAACRVAAVIAAIGHAGILVVAILDHAKDADTVWQELTASDRVFAVIQKYWLGFTLAGLVILAQIVRFIAGRKSED